MAQIAPVGRVKPDRSVRRPAPHSPPSGAGRPGAPDWMKLWRRSRQRQGIDAFPGRAECSRRPPNAVVRRGDPV